MSLVHAALYTLLTEVTEDRRFFRHFDTDYKKRLIAQKIVYLLQSRHNGSHQWAFNWYIAGPYSPSLARELYAIGEDESQLSRSDVHLTPMAKSMVKNLRRYVEFDYESLELDLAGWLELLASIDYVAKWKKLQLHQSELIGQVQKVKPKFTVSQIKEGISFLQERG